MQLTAVNVKNVLLECLFNDGEDTTQHVIGEGIKNTVGFHPDRLKDNTENIISMLSELPNQFKQSGGGGWTFLNACNTKDGIQWADLHQSIDELIILGNAIGKVSFQFPREMWKNLPGGMPYFIVKD